MRAKYFSHSSFLEAHIESNSSFAWCSILSAQDLVKVGFKRRIGSGSSLRVCRDPWIPKPHSFQPLIRPRQLDSSTTVASLIDIGQGDWDRAIIKECFCPEDSELILAILIVRSNHQDILL
ncbi:UNVERIFIED_CONTAM: hypothetical protein Sangu_2463600 [Sesamum angustifolium]|uniref:Uncharacterized protein n=1 Tax=Sesamum angustifolium TaxID=2727405 RepID=A0AAW2JAF5_9LAMI